jgi:hypothetical protein
LGGFRLPPRLLGMIGALVVIIPCLFCAGGGWLVWQSDTGSNLLANLGLPAPGDEEPTAEPVETVEPVFESPVQSVLPTPTETVTATETATPVPIVPTDTPTAIPTDTPEATPTDTPAPTDTPEPTSAPTSAQPAATAIPTDTPEPALKYGAPKLLEPANNFAYIRGNTVVLRWEPVGELAPDEQYAVRLVYRYQNKDTYGGANIKEVEWTLPLSLYGQIDGPEFLYEWFVQVERLNDDGSGTAISPESEHRKFTWR